MRGLLRPFRRDQKSDFANGAGRDLLESNAGQVLGTRCGGSGRAGELPWRSAFGSRLHLLRHASINARTRELARVYAGDALRRWEPRLAITHCEVLKDPRRERALIVDLRFDLLPGNRVAGGATLTGLRVAVPLAGLTG